MLLGDGNVYESTKTGDYRVSVCGSESTTKRWGALILPERSPQEFRRSPGTYQMYVNDKEMVQYLKESHGVCGPKSSNLPWPEDLPEVHLLPFLRGLWDTDGGITIWDRRAHGLKGNPEVKAGFGVDCESFVIRVRDTLERVCRVPRVAIKSGKGKYEKNRSISYGGSSAFRVLDYLYSEAPEALRNEDRVEVYRKACAIREAVSSTCCPCGEPARLEGRCHPCWYGQTPRTTGEGTVCPCGKSPILAKGMCSACYTRERRSRTTE